MRSGWKRVLSLVLTMCMSISLVSANVWAAESSVNGSGSVQNVEEVSAEEAVPEAEDKPVEKEEPEETAAPKKAEESESAPEEEKPEKLETQGIVASGECGAQGNNVTWTLDDKGTLTISGTGFMAYFENGNQQPWKSMRKEIKAVEVENGVSSIGGNAFRKCSNVNSATISNSVTRIEYGAFQDCTVLEHVNCGNGILEIDGSAFRNCSKLNTFEIPDSVTSIVAGAFAGCSSLKSIIIPKSVVSLGYNVFENCTSLTSVTICNNRIGVPGYIFQNCTNLTTISIPEVTNYYYITYIGENAFRNCKSLTSIDIPKNVVSIGVGAFAESGLNSVTIPESVSEIGYDAFCNCNKMTSVIIPATVSTIGDHAFGFEKVGTSYTDYVTKDDFIISGYEGTAAEIYATENGFAFNVLNESTTDNSILATGTCGNNLTWVLDKEETLTISGTGLMENYGYLTDDMKQPWYPWANSIKHIIIKEGVTSIGSGAFDNFKNLESISISNSVMSIGSGSFSDCESLTRITIPSSVYSIAKSAFSQCNNLSSVILQNGLTSIGESAFSLCTSLTSITIPDSVTYIGKWAFTGCYSLTSITIPDSVTSIVDDAISWRTDLIIYGYHGSAAETYALKHNISFVALDDTSGASDNETQPSSGGSDSDAEPVDENENIPIFFDDIYPAWYKTEYFSKKNPSTKSNNDLAMMAGILSWAVYGDNGKPSMKDVLHSLNIPDADILEEGKREDSLCYAIARKRIRVDGKLTNLLILDARGTVTHDERILDMTTVANQHFFGQIAYNGIYGFEAKIMEGLNNYLTSHPDIMEQPLKVLITGHSLGGAAANLLGARFTMFADSGSWWAPLCTKEDIYVYTFASIDSIYTNGTIYEGYENIHNITNFYDTFGPEGLHIFTAAGNSRYGKYGHIDIFYKNIMNVSDVVANHMWGAYLRAVRDHEVQYENPKAQKIASMHCPVDVDVYRDNVLVGRVVNNEVVSEVSTIPISVVNDVKYFALLGDGDYSFDIKATDDGEMKINVADAETGHENRTFDNISLTTGKQMYTAVYEDAPLEEMTVYVVDDQQAILSEVQEDGTETAPAEDACIHLWSADYIIDREPTYVEDGSESRYCVKCGQKKTGSERVITKLSKQENTISCTDTFSKTVNARKNQTFKLGASANGAKLSYKPSNSKIAVDKKGKVTIPKGYVGSFTIKITSDATDKYLTTKKTVTVTVNPAVTQLSSVKWDAKKKVAIAAWKKNTTGKGYQLQYSTDKKFKKSVKTVKVSKNKTVKATAKKLKTGTWYFRIRTVSGKNTSAWSKAKSLKIAK